MARRSIWSFILAAYILFIYSNSMHTAQSSSAQSGLVLEMMRQAMEALGVSGSWITEHVIRKSAHFGEYTVLGMLLLQWVRAYGFERKTRVLILVIFGFMTPFVDETIQLFVAGRSGQISDVWLDGCGVVFGIILLYAVLQTLGRRRRKKIGKKL